MGLGRRSLGHRFIASGRTITLLAMLLGAVLLPSLVQGGIAAAADGFQLLATLPVPHQIAPRLFEAMRRAKGCDS